MTRDRGIGRMRSPGRIFSFVLSSLSGTVTKLPSGPDGGSGVKGPTTHLLHTHTTTCTTNCLGSGSCFRVALSRATRLITSTPRLTSFSGLFMANYRSLSRIVLMEHCSLSTAGD